MAAIVGVGHFAFVGFDPGGDLVLVVIDHPIAYGSGVVLYVLQFIGGDAQFVVADLLYFQLREEFVAVGVHGQAQHNGKYQGKEADDQGIFSSFALFDECDHGGHHGNGDQAYSITDQSGQGEGGVDGF